MASSGKPKTTRMKLQREAALRERRVEKAARKQIRKQAQVDQERLDETDPDVHGGDADASRPDPEAGTGL